MGMHTELAIAAWQQEHGIEPATGQRAEILCGMSDAAFELIKAFGDSKVSDAAYELIKVVELERSGIRDGDGYWHGGDVIGGTFGDMIELCGRQHCERHCEALVCKDTCTCALCANMAGLCTAYLNAVSKRPAMSAM
jgi:hypothetical protein